MLPVALALYRKYRPRTFAEVIGQEHVTEPLMQALRSGRLNHAYLFSGPRGCGKTSSARILARSLNCERGPTPEPCGECASCVALAPDGAGSIDVIEIDAASHGGVDDARDLRERAIFAPVSSRFKVYVIDEAHMVSSAGFNALLKLVEEPPDYVKFVFATTEPEKVLGTIKSRTHHYPFRLIPPGVLRPYLEQLCATESVKVEPAVFPLVVRAGGGSARDTLSVLDQLIAGAGAEGVTYSRAVALLGVTDVALIDEMCDALAAGDGAAAFATIDRVAEAGHDPRRFATDLLGRLRDLIVLQQVPDAGSKGLLDAPDDELARMALQAQRFGAATLSRLADIVHNGLTEMRGTTAPRLLLELICARMLLPGADDSVGALLQRLERMERRLVATGDVPVAAPPPVPAGEGNRQILDDSTPPRENERPRSELASAPAADPPAPAADPPAPASAPAADAPAPAQASTPSAGPGAIDAVAVRRVWDEVLTYVGRKRRAAAAVAREATVRDVDGDTLVLFFKHQVHASMLSNGPEQLLLEAVYEILGPPAPDRTWQVRCEASGPPASAGQQSGGQSPGQGRQQAGQGGQQGGQSRPQSGPKSGQAPVPQTPRNAPARPAASAPSADTDDWPATAQPGSTTQPDPAPPAATAPAATAPAATALTATKAPATAEASATAKASVTAKGSATRKSTKAQPADEPPYDPDHDPPVRDAAYEGVAYEGVAYEGAAYEGFDPGDEPLDEVIDEQTARQTSEEQALHLLQQTLGAEKIG